MEVRREDYPYGDCEDVASYKEQYGATYTRTVKKKKKKIETHINVFSYVGMLSVYPVPFEKQAYYDITH